jgi:periplasmic divalent cation tolerance protein
MNGDEVVLVLCTAPSRPEPGQRSASELAQALVEARVCACVNVVPGVASVFRWEGRVDHAAEDLLLMKTTRATVPRLRERIAALHPYSVPEMLVFAAVDGLDAYLRWVGDAVGGG